MSTRVTFEELLEAGSHFGHLTRRWNPEMAPYIFMESNGIHIIDLHKTAAKIDEAADALRKIAQEGKTILFVGTKRQAQEPIAAAAEACGMPYVTERWAGGMLTNFVTMRKSIAKMDRIDEMEKDGTLNNLSKRERLQVMRQRAKLEKNFGSIKDMNRLPSAIFIVDVMCEDIAVREARRLDIPVFAIVDTNSDPRMVDYVIPANDDATTSIELITSTIANAVKEGVMERKITKADSGEQDSDDDNQGRRRRSRRRTGVRMEAEAAQAEEAPKAEEAPATEE